jgi:squalene synthase HpnC
MLVADPPPGGPAPAEVMARARGENFPVASRLLPRRCRSHLLAIYGFARLVDELGDSAQGDRLAALDWIERDLERAYAGHAEHPLMIALQRTLRECALPREPFARLIEANRTDQRVARYRSWEQLRGYCALSANPVGELVLRVFGEATPARIARSDSICTALQLIEHCQDVAEDFAAGRIYLPREELARFGCDPEDPLSARAGAAAGSRAGAAAVAGARDVHDPLGAVVAFQVRRAGDLLAEGAPLIDELRGRERLGVAGFIAGGAAALEAIERAGYDVRGGPPRAPRRRLLAALAREMWRSHRRRRRPPSSPAGAERAPRP